MKSFASILKRPTAYRKMGYIHVHYDEIHENAKSDEIKSVITVSRVRCCPLGRCDMPVDFKEATKFYGYCRRDRSASVAW